MRDGKGKQIWPDGAMYEGNFTNMLKYNLLNQIYLIFIIDIFYNKGEWKQNYACGKGKFFHTDGLFILIYN